MRKLMIKQLERLAAEHADQFIASMMVSTKSIIDMAEYVRELEQNAQADAEYAKAGWKCAGEVATECDELKQKLVDIQQRAEAAEAKLAGADKQPRPDYFLNRIESSDKWGQEVELRIYESQLDASKSQEDHGGAIIELFTAPVPLQ